MEGKEFYYQMMTDKDTNAVTFLITPKKFYDTEGCLFDTLGAVSEILPRGFTEFKPSYYTFAGDTTIAKQMLMTLGMHEINFGLTSVKPHRSHEHENEMEDEDFDDDDDNEDEDEIEEDEEEDNEPVINREVIHGPRVVEDPYHDDENDEDDNIEEQDDDDFGNEGERPPAVNPIRIDNRPNLGLPHNFGGLNLGQNNPPPPQTPTNSPQKQVPLPPNNPIQDGDLDSLLKEATDKKDSAPGFDYKNMSTAALLRHKKVMISTESYMEAAKVQKELDDRGIGGL